MECDGLTMRREKEHEAALLDELIRTSFKAFDFDESSGMDYKELRKALNGLGLGHLSDKEVMEEYDVSKDKSLQLDEYVNLVRGIMRKLLNERRQQIPHRGQ